MFKHKWLVGILFFFLFPLGFGQDEQVESEKPAAPVVSFSLGIALGYDSLGQDDSWQKITLKPDFGVGEFGIGLEVPLRYRFVAGNFEVRSEDWIPSSENSFWDLYLPMFRYIRYGKKGDPLFVKLGSIEDMTLGNGYLLGNYANTLFLPQTRIVGLSFDLDGALFNFPLLGLETVIGNLAAFDVFGLRLYVRPLIFTEVPLLKFMSLGASFVLDREPFRYVEASWASSQGISDPASALVTAFDLDFNLPLLADKVFSLACFGDFVLLQAGKALGGMLGVGGRIIEIITYSLQARFNGPNFIPVYFDATYDVSRAYKYPLLENGSSPAYMGWFAQLGLDLADIIFLSINLDGPFGAVDSSNPDNYLNYPHLRGLLKLKPGLIPGLSADFIYDKTLLGKDEGFFPDLIDPEGAIITLRLNYQFGPAIISLRYDIRYVPDKTGDPWVVTSGLESSLNIAF